MLSLNKYLKTCKLLIVVSIFLFKNNILSQNLIQNGSFESYSVSVYGCAYNFSMVNIWQQIFSPDHFTTLCTLGNFGVPNNDFGITYPKNGNAYVGIASYSKPYELKEYIFQNLNTPLIANKSYYVSFFLSRGDKIAYAIRNIGANFSITQPTLAAGNAYISANPQVKNQGSYLTDTIGWTKIEGYFTAQGGEQYITIGTFDSNANSDTLFVGTANPIPYDAGTAYYFIDSVSLYDSLYYITNIKQIENDIKLNLYPNPNNGNFNLEYQLNKEAEFVITDITGRIVNQYALLPSQNKFLIKEEELNAGIYFYLIKMNNSIIKNDKLIIIK